jgi:hypothetical protein
MLEIHAAMQQVPNLDGSDEGQTREPLGSKG